jgi:hypothetical protein
MKHNLKIQSIATLKTTGFNKNIANLAKPLPLCGKNHKNKKPLRS